MNSAWKLLVYVVLVGQCGVLLADESWFAPENRYALNRGYRVNRVLNRLKGPHSLEKVMAGFRNAAEAVPDAKVREIRRRVLLLADEQTRSGAANWLIENAESAVSVMIVEFDALDSVKLRCEVIGLLADEAMMSAIEEKQIGVVVFLIGQCYASKLQIRKRALTSMALYVHEPASLHSGTAVYVCNMFSSGVKLYPPYYVLQQYAARLVQGKPLVMGARQLVKLHHARNPDTIAEPETARELDQGGIDVDAIRKHADAAEDKLLQLAARSDDKLARAVSERIADLGVEEKRDDAIDWFRTAEGLIAPLLVREYREGRHDEDRRTDMLDLLRYDNLRSARGTEYANEIAHFLLGHLLAEDIQLQHDTVVFMGLHLYSHYAKGPLYIEEIDLPQEAFRHVEDLLTRLATLRSEGPYGLLQCTAAKYFPYGREKGEYMKRIPPDLRKRRTEYYFLKN